MGPTFGRFIGLPPRRFLWLILLPNLVLLLGTLGYHFIEGWSYFDSLYMTAITLTTVGYNEVHQLSLAGRWFTTFLSLCGVFILFYPTSQLIWTRISARTSAISCRQEM